MIKTRQHELDTNLTQKEFLQQYLSPNWFIEIIVTPHGMILFREDTDTYILPSLLPPIPHFLRRRCQSVLPASKDQDLTLFIQLGRFGGPYPFLVIKARYVCKGQVYIRCISGIEIGLMYFRAYLLFIR